jgi:hypothetical protein
VARSGMRMITTLDGKWIASGVHMRTTVLLCLLAAIAQAQSFPRYDFTFSGGAAACLGKCYGPNDTSPSLGATGGVRITPGIELEAGVFAAIDPVGQGCDHFGCITPSSDYIWVPFGVRFIRPIAHDRLEFSAGGGGLFEHFSTSAQVGLAGYDYNGFGGYVKASLAVTLDRHRHFWIGATPRLNMANSGNYRDRWFLITGDIGVRF